MVVLLKIEGNCSCLRAKVAHMVGHLPQVALDQSFHVVGKCDFRAQAQQVFENLKAALAGLEADFTHAIKLTIYFVDMTQLPILREAHVEKL